ncbi:MAG: phosphatase domain-containing protein [Blastopirellula sp. JB062]
MQPDDMAVTDLTASQSVVVYPTYGYPSADGRRWVVEVHGCIFEKVPDNLPRWILLRLLARLMDATPEDLQTEIFQQRILGFTVYKHRGKQIVVEIGGQRYRLLQRSRKNGQFRGRIEIPREKLDEYLETTSAGCFLPLQVVGGTDGERTFPARIQLLEDAGMSIISDIDDTVKHTDVATRKSMLANTFLREFSTVPGITDLFKTWEEQGAAFHYVTSSPWQLFSPLSELFLTEGLPGGTFHMKSIRFRDPSVLRLFIDRQARQGGAGEYP